MNIFTKYCLVVSVSAIGICEQILLKKGLRPFSSLEFSGFLSKMSAIVFQPVMLVALFCYVVGIVLYLFLLSKVELTSVYPICTSLTFGGITFFGWLILNESLTWPKILGISFIVAGIFLIDRFG